MQKKFKVEFEIEADFVAASGVQHTFEDLFPNWKNIKVIEIRD